MNGCSAPAATLASAPVELPLSVLSIDPSSQVTASAGDAMLYASGAGGTVVAIDVADPMAPMETELVSAGTIAALYATLGIFDPPRLSGIAVLDEDSLVVVEHTANVLLLVDRQAPNVVELFAGQPNTVPGNADGLATGVVGLARFSFEAACQICPSGSDGAEVYVADSGNHSLRLVTQGQVFTLAGMGFPISLEGSLGGVAFDTPSGLTITCDDTLVISERGDFGSGQYLRLATFATDGFGGLSGTIDFFVGDGVAGTTGGSPALDPGGTLARVTAPVSPLATTNGELYWIDAGSGVLRRLSNGVVDCPLWPDCDAATSGTPNFTPGAGAHSITQTPDGALYVLDAEAGKLFRIP